MKTLLVISATLLSFSVWTTEGSPQNYEAAIEVSAICTSMPSVPGRVNAVNMTWSDPDGQHFYSYDIFLKNHTKNTWTYQVQGVEGSENLSYWLLEIINDAPPQCEGHISNTSPTASIGMDDRTGHKGVKWDSTQGPFILTMDDNYGTGITDVLVKSGKYFGVCQMMSPVCPMLPCGRTQNDRCGDRLDAPEEALQFGF